MTGRSAPNRSTVFCAADAPDALKQCVSGVSFDRQAYPRARGRTKIGFRQEYRSRILGWYHGYVHVVIIYAMGAAAFYVYVAHIHAVTELEWLTVPLTFLFT